MSAPVQIRTIAEYKANRTPNPCVRCNEHIKFRAVLDRALALGFDGVATGHYAVLTSGADGPELHRAADADKDQSYVLAVIEQELLRHCYFPLGGSLKGDVRAEAEARGLRTASKPASHAICFIPDGDTAGFLTTALGEKPGPIVDVSTGRDVGSHQGTFTVTIAVAITITIATTATTITIASASASTHAWGSLI